MSETPIKVLVVDDDPDMRATLADFLSAIKVDVRTAGEVGDARRMLEQENPPFDLVLTDLRLPDGNGIEVLQAARNRTSECLVTIITGYGSLESAIAAIRAGAYDYLAKPFTLDEIGIQVRNMISRVSLARENARLSMRLQELYQQLDRLQRKRSEPSRLEGEVQKLLLENSEKLDLLVHMLAQQTSDPAAADVRHRAVAAFLSELQCLDNQKQASAVSDARYEEQKRALVENLAAAI